MKIKRVVVGPLEANCYILIKNDEAVLIDPGNDPKTIEKELQNVKVVGILITHHHFDHIGALSYFEEKYHLKHNEKIKNFDYEIIKTPGHSKDSLSFYFKEENCMFTGDFIFKGTIGRMDLPGGNKKEMQESLAKIERFSDKIIIYPGHYEKTSLQEEKANFKYFF